MESGFINFVLKLMPFDYMDIFYLLFDYFDV